MATSDPVILLPVKPPASGKSRLAGLAPGTRQRLARAFALDTLSTILVVAAPERVIVVTTDDEMAATACALGVQTRLDAVPGDLNGTLAAVARECDPHQLVLAVCADLPALRAAELVSVVALAPRAGASFVRDAQGDGTTTYAAPARLFAPRFGIASAAAHLTAGAEELGTELASLRADVDDGADLERAIALGVGAHTRSALGLP